MNPVLTAVLVVAGLALLAGLVLAVASVVLAVPRDERWRRCGNCAGRELRRLRVFRL